MFPRAVRCSINSVLPENSSHLMRPKSEIFKDKISLKPRKHSEVVYFNLTMQMIKEGCEN